MIPELNPKKAETLDRLLYRPGFRRGALTFLVAAMLALPARAASPAAEANDKLLAEIAPRLKALHETDEFRRRGCSATRPPLPPFPVPPMTPPAKSKFLAEKSEWTLKPGVNAWEGWPARQSNLSFGGMAPGEPKSLDLWKKLPADPTVPGLQRNNGITQPPLRIKQPSPSISP